MQKDALEKTCYVGGAGAFGVFIRWLQTQIAFNDEGLPDASFFNVLVPLAILAAGALFFVFVRRWRERNYYLPGAFQKALENDGLLFSILRWFLGALMAIGGVVPLYPGRGEHGRAAPQDRFRRLAGADAAVRVLARDLL